MNGSGLQGSGEQGLQASAGSAHSRRDVLRLGAIGAIAANLPMLSGCKASASAPPEQAATVAAPRKRVLRFAHMTDIHVQPELRASEGMTAALVHLRSQPDQPGLVITGGDLIMDSFDSDDARTKLQWEIFNKVWADNCRIPTKHTLGNHDCWGFNQKGSGTTGNEPNWGKKRATDALGMTSPYHSFDMAGWHFVILDSTFREGNGYIARLDDAQFEWLKGDLAAVPAGVPIVVVSHMPIVTVTTIFDGNDDVNRTKPIAPARMHVDGKRITKLFRQYPNLRLCISGHIHQNDRIDRLGVTYICAGAVSGAWWKGPNDDTREGYTLVDLYSDGMFEYAYVGYGWKA